MSRLTQDRAMELLLTATSQPHLLRHAQAVSAAMGAMARRLGGDEAYWRAVGLLHDYDYERYPGEHLRHTERPLAEAGVDGEAVRAILAHGYGICTDTEPLTDMEKALYTVDELTGLVSAAALMRPGGIAELEAKSVMKKFKDKAFAAKIDREVIRKGAEMLGMELSEAAALCIEGMRDSR